MTATFAFPSLEVDEVEQAWNDWTESLYVLGLRPSDEPASFDLAAQTQTFELVSA